MQGDDVEAWQEWLVEAFSKWEIDYPLVIDGDYGQHTRAASASMCRAWGMESAAEAMEHGVTPELRIKLRNYRRTDDEERWFAERKDYRRRLRARYEHPDVCYPLPPRALITDDWGWHGTAHDGVDLICAQGTPLLAICKAKVVRAAASGWSGLYAPEGDGIVILQSLVDDGPFFKGLCFGYGHAEHPQVRAGQVVDAGEFIARAGMANAGHTHFMANGGGFPASIGHGDRDPMPFLDYALKHQ
jgi:murein DD-endopeptidase MepM/ murein hydrolase activator NlpD